MMMSNWRQYESEIVHYIENTTHEEKKLIILSGLQTEFWKLLRAYLLNTLRVTELKLQQLSTNSLDDLFKLGKLNNSYKAINEIFVLIEQLANPPVQQNTAVRPPQPRAASVKVAPKRVIKKEISNE
jgi:hypothetical protein